MSLRKNTFKDKFLKQKNIFKYDSKCNAIELSNFIWKNSCGNISTTLEWDILDKGKDYPKNTHCLFFIYLFIYLFIYFEQKKSVRKNFAKFTRKHPCWSLFLILLQASRNFINCFPVNFEKF